MATKNAQWNFAPLEGVNRVVAVASGKGGVGKSTTAVMLAHGLRHQGLSVGLLDADIYGPSLPRMLGLRGKPEVEDNKMLPLSNHGIWCNSMGFLIEDETAVVWRGPMITKALHQLARLTLWNYKEDIDILLVDLPPGTGDVHLSMIQQVPLDGAIIVTTPQEIAIQDARKCIDMFRKVKTPILGIIENMSWLEGLKGERQFIFGQGGGKKLADQCQIPFLGSVPLIPKINAALDQGTLPTTEALQNYHPFLSAFSQV